MRNDNESSGSTDVVFSFMSAGPRLRVSVPNYLAPIPELSSPLGNPNGARSFDFLPSWRTNQIPPEYPLIRTMTDRMGRTVELYRWLQEPPQWFVRWPLANGNVWTHLREEDGDAMAERTVESVSIVEDSETGLPFIFADAPFRLAVSARPGYQEFCQFRPQDESGGALCVQRPSHVAEGRTVSAPAGREHILLRAGVARDVEVQLITPLEMSHARRELEEVMASLREA